MVYIAIQWRGEGDVRGPRVHGGARVAVKVSDLKWRRTGAV